MTPADSVNPRGGQSARNITCVIDGSQAASGGIAQARLQLKLWQQGREGESGQPNRQNQAANATHDDLPGMEGGRKVFGHVLTMLSVCGKKISHLGFCSTPPKNNSRSLILIIFMNFHEKRPKFPNWGCSRDVFLSKIKLSIQQ
jgi:hypothetical protein